MDNTALEIKSITPVIEVSVAPEPIKIGYKECVVRKGADEMIPLVYSTTREGERVEKAVQLPNFPEDQKTLLRVVRGNSEFFYKVKNSEDEKKLEFVKVEVEDLPEDKTVIEVSEAIESAEKVDWVDINYIKDRREEIEMRSNAAIWQELKKNGEIYQKPVRWLDMESTRTHTVDVTEWDYGKKALNMPNIMVYIPDLVIRIPIGDDQQSYYQLEGRPEEGKNDVVRYLRHVDKVEAEKGRVVDADEIRKIYDTFGQVTERTIKWYRRWKSEKKA